MPFRRGPKTQISVFPFEYGGERIEMVKEYKYLGLMINEFNDFHQTAKYVAKSACRALGILISKAKAVGNMPYNCYSKLYDCLVQPIIDYGSAIWGTHRFSCIESVQHRAERFFMGVGRYCPNAALQGDMGWTHPEHRVWINVCRMWIRLSNADQSRVTHSIFVWAKELALRHGIKNWIFRLNSFMQRISLDICTASNTNKGMLKSIDCELNNYFENEWAKKVSKIEANRGTGRNKLRTYRLFKTKPGAECYLQKVRNRHHRSAFAKFRSGTAPLQVEVGRFNNIPYDERLCTLCKQNDVENEMHILLHCDFYKDIQDDLNEYCTSLDNMFTTFNDIDRFSYIMSNENVVFKAARACYQILQRRYSFINCPST